MFEFYMFGLFRSKFPNFFTCRRLQGKRKLRFPTINDSLNLRLDTPLAQVVIFNNKFLGIHYKGYLTDISSNISSIISQVNRWDFNLRLIYLCIYLDFNKKE